MQWRLLAVRFSLLGVILVPLVSMTATAQITTGGLRGVVTDATGGVVPGASVVAKNVQTNVEYTTVTGDEGLYVIPRIPPGPYTLTVELAGFKKAEHTDIDIIIGRETVIDVQLETGEIAETVTVETASETLVQRDQVQISATFEEKKLKDLPVDMRAGLDRVALLVPGITPGFGNVNSNGVTLSANGNRARANNFTIDGVDNNDLSIGGPNYFLSNRALVSEFQVVTNNFSAEYGRNQGAVINIVTKSGTNAYHGSVFWDHRDRKNFDSLTNLERRSGQKDPARDLFNTVAYGVGGPIVKDKAFFFAGGQFQRNPGIADLRTTALAPTPAGIQALKSAFPNNPAVQYYADFSAFALPIGNPTIRPDVAQSTIQVGNVTVPMAAPRRTVSRANNLDEYAIRGDVEITQDDRVWGRFLYQDAPGQDNLLGVGGFTGDIPFQTRQAGAGWIRTISPRMVNEFRFNSSRLFVVFGGGATGGKGQIPHPDEIDKALTFLNPAFQAANGAPLLSIGPATNLPQGRIVESYQFSDVLSYTAGRHQLKMGVDVRRLENRAPFLPNVNGAFTFPSATAHSTNSPSSLIVALGPATLVYDQTDQFYFFQDDWRIRDNFTLNLGIRYENSGQPINLLHRITSEREADNAKAFWRTNVPLPARTLPRIPTDSNNWAPRVGFVYTPQFDSGFGRWLFGGKNKTVISGGYSIAYDAVFYNLMLNISTSAPLVFLTGTVLPVPDNVPTGDKVRDAAVKAGAIAFNTFNPELFARTTINPSFRSPYAQQWSLRWQRELKRDNVLEVRYVGTHGVGLFQTINANPFVGNLINGFSRQARVESATGELKAFNFPGFPQLFPGVKPLTCVDNPATRDLESACNGRLFPFGVARERINGAQSIYHGLQTRFDSRISDFLTAGMTYTFSQTIDNSSEVFSFAGGNSVAVAQNPLNLTRDERGRSGFDIPHVFTAHWIWEIPFMREQSGILGRILGGWQANGIVRVQSERRFTPVHQLVGRNPYEDSLFMANFFQSGSHFRPFSGNSNAPLGTVAITDIDACIFYGLCGSAAGVPILRQSPTGYWSMNALNQSPRTFQAVTPNDARFIINGPGAALKFGTPFGNIGRNMFQGDRVEAVDLSVFKDFRIREEISLQYRLELFNAFNHPTFGIPNSITLDNAGRTFYNFQENSGGRRTISMGLTVRF